MAQQIQRYKEIMEDGSEGKKGRWHSS